MSRGVRIDGRVSLVRAHRPGATEDMSIRTTFRISVGARLLPFHLASCSGNFLDIRRGGAADYRSLWTLGAFGLDKALVFRSPGTKYSLYPFLILELTTPRARTLKDDILPGSNLRTLASVWKHCHPIPRAFAHCLQSLDPVLPSVFHDQRKSGLRNKDTLYEF